MKTLIGFFVVLMVAIVSINRGLKNGDIRNFLDTHPDPRWSPLVHYQIGIGYETFKNLTEAATYYIRIADRYPSSDFADDALARYLDCIDRLPSYSKSDLVEENQKYLDRFPKGKHVETIQHRLDALRTGSS